MEKIFIAILFFSGITFSQVTEEEQTKIVLANYVLELNKAVELNTTLTESMNVFVGELQAIENPSDELIALLKKYNLYKEDNVNIPGKD